MSEPLFADGIGEITVTNGVVRLEFFVFSLDRNPSAKPGEAPRLQPSRTLTVAMPLAGFVGSLKSIDEFKQKLVDNGLLKAAAEPAKNSDSTAKPANTN